MPMLRIATLSSLAVLAALMVSPAYALTAKECSAKYQAAKAAGTLNGMKWNDFRKAECGTDAAAADDDATTTKAAKSKTARSKAAADDEGGGLSMKECSAKYQAAKAAGTLNGMKWNDFRKAECGADAASAQTTTKSKTAKNTAADDDGANGLSMKECSAKYQAAKAAGTLNGMKWNDFRKAECGADAAAAETTTKSKTAKNTAANDNGGAKGLSMKECSAKYQTAKADGSLNGMKWNDFRKAECGAGAADDDTVPSMDEAVYKGEPETPAAKAPRGVTFPRAIDSKFASETPAKQRMHTCLEGYYDNKDRNTLNGLRWIQKGGGYYSLCNARLKGNS